MKIFLQNICFLFFKIALKEQNESLAIIENFCLSLHELLGKLEARRTISL